VTSSVTKIQNHLTNGWNLRYGASTAWIGAASLKETNLASAKRGGMVMAVYVVKGEQIYVILDAGHETLTVLLPEDY
jgi:hypothetical protein